MCILDSCILKYLEKSPKLDNYNCTGDSYEHMDNVNDYQSSWGAMKCKLFVLTLKGANIKWIKTLLNGYINS